MRTQELILATLLISRFIVRTLDGDGHITNEQARVCALLHLEFLIEELEQIRAYHIDWGKPTNLIFKTKLETYNKTKIELENFEFGSSSIY